MTVKRTTVVLDESTRELVESAASAQRMPVATWIAREARKAAIRQALAAPEPALSFEEAQDDVAWDQVMVAAASEHVVDFDREGAWA